MRVLRGLVIGMALAVSACSGGNGVRMNVADDSCAGLGFAAGSAAYAQCVEDRDIRKSVTDRSLMAPSHNPDPLSVSQQYQHTVGAIVNCTSYSLPGARTVCG